MGKESTQAIAQGVQAQQYQTRNATSGRPMTSAILDHYRPINDDYRVPDEALEVDEDDSRDDEGQDSINDGTDGEDAT